MDEKFSLFSVDKDSTTFCDSVMVEDFPVITVNEESISLHKSVMEENITVSEHSTDLCGSVGEDNSSMGTIIQERTKLEQTFMEEDFPMVTVNEERANLGECITGGNISNTKKKSAQSWKRKPPNKVSFRKRLTRAKGYRRKANKLKAFSTNPEIRNNDLSPVSKNILSHSEITDGCQNTPVPNVSIMEQERIEQSLMTVIKQEPPSSTENSIATSKPPVDNTKVRKIIFQKDTQTPGVIIGTPVILENSIPVSVTTLEPRLPNLKPQIVPNNTRIHPIHKMKSVFMKCFKKPVSTTSQPISVSNSQHPITKLHMASSIFQEINSEQVITPPPDIHSVTLKSDVDLSNFIDESTDFDGASRQRFLSEVKQTEDLSTNIPVAEITHESGNIPTEFVVAQSRSTPIITPVENISTESLNIPASSRTPSLNRISNIGMVNSTVSQQPDIVSTDQLLETVGKILVESIPPPWITVLKHNGVAVCLLSHSDVVTIQRSLLVEANGKVTVGIHGKELPADNPFWQHVKPFELRNDTVAEFTVHIKHLLDKLRGMEVCKAVEEFEPLWKTVTNCYVDLKCFHEFRFGKCCRSHNCQLLVPSLNYKRCNECSKVRVLLSRRALVDSKKPETLSLHKAFKYLTSPEKRERFEMAVKEIKRLRAANKRLSEKLNLTTNEDPADSFADNLLSNDTEMADESDS